MKKLELLKNNLAKPVRILFLTSVRDISICDRNGEYININNEQFYMEGIIERTAKELQNNGILYGLAEIAAIVVDDVPRDLKNTEYFPLGEKYFFRENIKNASGTPLVNIIHSIKSSFREVPLIEQRERKKRKSIFEMSVMELFEDIHADIIISDHYMARIEYLHRWFPKRVLNIHPAITVAGHEYCFRGKTPTADAIASAKNKKTYTGATFHFVNENIDEGPAIAYCWPTEVFSNDSLEYLRFRNYQNAKLPLFVEGLKHYILNIYPQLDVVDISKLSPYLSSCNKVFCYV